MQAPGFWDDQAGAAKVSSRARARQRRLDTFRSLESDIADYEELSAMDDESMAEELEAQRQSIEARLAELEEARLFSGRYDSGDAVVSVSAGAGGTDAQDWAEMLLRQEMRWAERRGFKIEMLEASPGEEAGLKSASVHRARRQRLRPLLARRRACTGWCASRRSTRPHGATPRSRRSRCRRSSRRRSTSTSTRPTSRSTPTARRAPAAST